MRGEARERGEHAPLDAGREASRPGPGAEEERPVPAEAAAAPPAETLEAWALRVLTAPTLEQKLAPGPVPRALGAPPEDVGGPGLDDARGPGPDDAGGPWPDDAGGPGPDDARRLLPSRPAPLVRVERAPRTPRPGALVDPRARARLLHLFFHHELQAAELFAWALLAFPEAAPRFRRGLAAIAGEELRHARAYAARVEALGLTLGEVGARDWFWERLAGCASPLAFVSLMGLGLEGGNLDHGRLWARRLAQAGDAESAALVRAVARDEVRHVAFAARWFRRFTGGLCFERWRSELPAPLTPGLMRGAELDREARAAAGLGADFLAALESWERAGPSS